MFTLRRNFVYPESRALIVASTAHFVNTASAAKRNPRLPMKGSGDRECVSWETEFYHEDMQISLFDDEPLMIRDTDTAALKAYIEKQLRTVFPCVSGNSRVLYNSRRSPFFLFCFAVSSKSIRAQEVALRIADHILKNRK